MLDEIFVNSVVNSEHGSTTEPGFQTILCDARGSQMSSHVNDWQHDVIENFKDIPFEPDGAYIPGDDAPDEFDDIDDKRAQIEDEAIEESLAFSDKILTLIQAFVSELAAYQTKSQSSQILLSALLPPKIDHQLIELGSSMSNGVLCSIEGVMQALPKIRSLNQLQKVIFLMWLHEHSSNVEKLSDVVNLIKKMEDIADGESTLSIFKRRYYVLICTQN